MTIIILGAIALILGFIAYELHELRKALTEEPENVTILREGGSGDDGGK